MAQLDLFLAPKQPWNHRRLIGPKPPFKPKHVWGTRQQLKTTGRVRDLALFNCAIDAKLRGCGLVKPRICDVAPGGSLRARATIIQQKTGQSVRSHDGLMQAVARSVWRGHQFDPISVGRRRERRDNAAFSLTAAGLLNDGVEILPPELGHAFGILGS
jgi:hypothetical protein